MFRWSDRIDPREYAKLAEEQAVMRCRVQERVDPGKQWIMGVDLGQTNDQSCYVLGERTEGDFDGPLEIKDIWLWPRGTDYCQVVDDCLNVNPHFVVPDFCGVGRPVLNMFQRRARELGYKGKLRPVHTLPSNASTKTVIEKGQTFFRVPKVEMVTAIQAMWPRLRFPDIPESQMLKTQLQNYRKIKQTHRSSQFGNKPGAGMHDDLVSALGLLCWFCLHFGSRRLAIFT